MMAATPTKLSSEADVGRSKAQHVVILAFCSKIAGITYSASPNTALDPRLGAKTGLNDEVFVNKLTASVPNGKCQMIIYYDQFETWEVSFSDLVVGLVGKAVVDNLASLNFEYFEDAGDFVVSHTDIRTASTEIQGWLRARDFCVFHGTRLLPEEILSVQKKRAAPLSSHRP